ncbi:cryptochrome/photolyase family protein [Sphingobacterium suaedae]|uniref:Cryptochrome/photolyase family protein n=1 Tax=Sphingobacterium suaedae TaxID=1686402 RepID=A0ABW5KC07_9SPHI
MIEKSVVIFWFRRDLRLDDNRGLCRALSHGGKVLPLFIFDTDILDALNSRKDRRLVYIQQALVRLQTELRKQGSDICVRHGVPEMIFRELLKTYCISAVYCNEDYEPEAIRRDNDVREILEEHGVTFHTYKDQVIFDAREVRKADGSPYSVYTPYSRQWRAKLKKEDYTMEEPDVGQLLSIHLDPVPPLSAVGFLETGDRFDQPTLDERLIKDYDRFRDFPALDHTTHLGVALRFGTLSIRRCVAVALQHNETWLGELIWREFFMQILFHYPAVVNRCFKEKYEHVSWRNNESEFYHWCTGNTGYPLVDAGMRQLNQTGFMHNRVRMVAASFLTKHLLVDWRWGEAYFAEKLLDYELASNNGNWQWAAGCGCDAAPYFRIFNPQEQTKKFDKDLHYIKRWNPDFESLSCPPLVDHVYARERALKVYRAALADR